MKAFHYAIASIVDANTGYGLHQEANVDTYAAVERRARKIRSRSILDLFSLMGRSLRSLRGALQDYQVRRRGIRQLAAMSDRQLDDIGLDRGDIIALETGMIDLPRLEARRVENLGNKRVTLYRGNDLRYEASRHALNDAVFAKAKCA